MTPDEKRHLDGFMSRVDRAAAHIGAGRPITRALDNCFESYDGDAVSHALFRRAAKNPSGNLARNIKHYLCGDANAAAERDGPHMTLDQLREMSLSNYRAAQERWARMRREQAGRNAYAEDCRRQPNYHDDMPRKAWADLGEIERESWIRNPTPRENFRTELTSTGEQAVIPGCERNESPKASQLDLFG